MGCCSLYCFAPLLDYSPRHRRLVLWLLGAALLWVAVLSLASGVIPTRVVTVLAALPDALAAVVGTGTGAHGDDTHAQLAFVLAQIRIPRLVLGLLVGGGLALGGAVMQGLFRNPMADPGLLGVSSGAALGAVAAIALGGGWLFAGAWLLPVSAFGGGLVSIAIVHRLSVTGGVTDIKTMLLAGIAVNAIAGACIGLLSYLADDARLRDLIFWSLGSLEITGWRKLGVALLFMTPAFFVLPRYAGALNANLLGENEAAHLGVDMEKTKRQLIAWVALVTGIGVSLAGVIGFVGLLVPHLIRIALGPDHRLLLPASALAGAVLLTGADIVARALIAPAELPIGIITALLGGPFFLWLLVRFQRANTVR